jgi:hypothetical protein
MSNKDTRSQHSPYTLMKEILIITSIVLGIIGVDACSRQMSTRDYDYERYCDSIYIHDEDYYFDVLMETDEYQDYIEQHGAWWNQN